MAATSSLRIDSELQQDRRTAERTATVFRPVLIETDDFAGFCLVRNLSLHGLMGDVYTSFADEQPVTIHFGHTAITGMLKWCKDARIGIEFDTPISLSEILGAMGARTVEGLINRAPRLQMRCPAEITIGERIRSAEVEDISQRGVRVRAPFMKVNEEVVLQLDGLERRKAIVRWAQAGTAGLNFLQPLNFQQLAQWVVQQQANMRPSGGKRAPETVDFERGWTVKIA
jgi:hypothetical protein